MLLPSQLANPSSRFSISGWKMPSKANKHSKTSTKSSESNGLTSSLAKQSSPFYPNSDFESDVVSNILEKASQLFPSMIGTSAIVGKLKHVEPQLKGCVIWLSESTMTAMSVAPGSTVTVSIASKEKASCGVPLYSAAYEYDGHHGLEDGHKDMKKMGYYFSLATIFPSNKVLKNDVRISSSLSYTMGCPSIGSILFVYPLPVLSDFFFSTTQNEIRRQGMLPSWSVAEKIHLEYLPLKVEAMKICSGEPPVTCSSKVASSQLKDDHISSPRAPHQYNKANLNSQYSTESSSSLESCVSSLPAERSFVSSCLQDALRDEKANKLLQLFVSSWLHHRKLLHGNLVAIPVLSEVCLFKVLDLSGPLTHRNESLADERSFEHDFNHMQHVFVVNHGTTIRLSLSPSMNSDELYVMDSQQSKNEFSKSNTGSDILALGGLSNEYAVLKDMIFSAKNIDLSRVGLQSAKAVLLHGPPGTGKTSLVHLCARDTGIRRFSINGPEIVKESCEETEAALHKIFNSASRAVPCMVFIDELHAIAPAQERGGDELSQRMVRTLLDLMDGICEKDGLLVVAATNMLDLIDPTLRKAGKFDREVEVGVPSPQQRFDIFRAVLSNMKHSLSDMDIQQLVNTTYGFVGADIASLCDTAAIVCLENHKPKKSYANTDLARSIDASDYFCNCTIDYSDLTFTNGLLDDVSSPTSVTSSNLGATSTQTATSINANGVEVVDENCLLEDKDILKITLEDFLVAKRNVKPSAMREVMLEVPDVKWEDIGGQEEVKSQLREAVEWGQKHRDDMEHIGSSPPGGVLMFGPPGCSKTLMARAVASEAGLNFFAIKGPELHNKYVGESEKAVRDVFAKARANAPSVIFFDEFDGLASFRGSDCDETSVSERVVSQLLNELDGFHERVDVTVIAATNRPDKIDPAVLRPGRIDRIVYVGPPNEADREDIFCICLRKMPCNPDVSIRNLAQLTNGYTGADIASICHQAAVAALEEDINALETCMRHFKEVIAEIQPTETESYDEAAQLFQRFVRSSLPRMELTS